MRVSINGGWLDIGEPAAPAPPVVIPPPVAPPVVPAPPAVKKPYFRVGSATGKAGETVEVPVFGGCSGAMSGFHFGVGCGDWQTKPTKVVLSKYLADYVQDAGPLEIMRYFGFDEAVGPSAFVEYALGLWTSNAMMEPLPIPPDTELFRITFQLAVEAAPTVLELIAKDEFWYTQGNPMRRNYVYTNSDQGWHDINMVSGQITVVA